MKKFLSYLSCLMITNLVAIPEPYASINELPFDDHGWFFNEDALSVLMEDLQPHTIIEVGSWLGLSTRYFANAVSKTDGKVYAVDHWLGSREHHARQEPHLKNLFHTFLSNIKQSGFADVVVPVRMQSLEAAAALNVKADLIYIDASHETKDVLDDIFAWYPHLNEGGLFCGDDWKWISVRKAVIKASKELHVTLHSSGNFWWFE